MIIISDMQPATDKQIKYLTLLTKKVSKVRAKYPKAFNNVSNVEDIDWENERSLGMTTADASLRIEAYLTILRNMNTILILCNKQ